MNERRVILLGSTGSIGTQALDALAHLNALHARGEHSRSYRVVGLAAGTNATLLAQQASALGVRDLAIRSTSATVRAEIEARATPVNGNGAGVKLRVGDDAPERLVREVECDIVLAAMVGAAGLPATLAAAQLGRDIALANKETLVAAGGLITAACRVSGAKLLPVDSEHAAAFELLAPLSRDPALFIAPPMSLPREVSRVILTASGGPFRTWTKQAIDRATRAEALTHPTWKMGPKVTIDSASLTNKALELIEAYWLFGAAADQLAAVVHPQSIIHAMVERVDGTTLMQAAAADMRTPIMQAFAWPEPARACGRRLDPLALPALHFEPPDLTRFPALGMAFDVLAMGGTAGAIFNAANEEAVAAFLREDGEPMPFSRIHEVTAWTLANVGHSVASTLADVFDADRAAREAARLRIAELAGVVTR